MRWEDQRDKLIKEHETAQQKERKRKRAEEEKAAAAKKAKEDAEQAVAQAQAATKSQEREPEALFDNPHFGIKYGWNCQDHYVVYKDPDGKLDTVRCCEDTDEHLICIEVYVEGKRTVEVLDRERLCGLANLTNQYVRFEHCNRQIVAKVPYDNGTTELKVVWYEGNECTMSPRRTRLEVHPDQEKAALADRDARRVRG